MEKMVKFPEIREEEVRGMAMSYASVPSRKTEDLGSRLRFPLDELYNYTSVDFSVCEMHYCYQQNGFARIHFRAVSQDI